MNAALPVEEAYRILTDEKQNGHDNMEAKDWGWSIEHMCVPIRSSLPPAPDELLKTIYCRCKTNCDSKRCHCDYITDILLKVGLNTINIHVYIDERKWKISKFTKNPHQKN
jgi:hypothetical protein